MDYKNGMMAIKYLTQTSISIFLNDGVILETIYPIILPQKKTPTTLPAN